MLSKFFASCLLLATLSACSSSKSNPAPPPPQSGGSGPGETSTQISLKSELDNGKTLILTVVDFKLANDINDRMGTHNLITLQDGKEIIGGDDMKNWCQIGSKNGFVSGGDRFEMKKSDVQDKIYLAARQVYLAASSYLGFQCRKGGMDQSEMTLKDLQQIMGSLVKLELAE